MAYPHTQARLQKAFVFETTILYPGISVIWNIGTLDYNGGLFSEDLMMMMEDNEGENNDEMKPKEANKWSLADMRILAKILRMKTVGIFLSEKKVLFMKTSLQFLMQKRFHLLK